MKKSILKTMSLLLCTAMMAIIMLPQAAFAATDYTCYIGSNGYSTLAEAVEAANTGDTIWMTANDSVSTTFDVDKNLTIELEGYTLANACMRFVGDITVNINDRAGTAKINTNQNSGFKVTDYEYDSRVRAAFYLTGGAKVILSGTTGGTEIYGGAQCTNGLTILEKAAVVGKGCKLVINGGSLVYSGYTGTDGVFVCDTGILTLKDILIRRSSSNTGGSSISYANVPTIENPLTITKGHFYGGMWVEGSSTINGVYISRGTLSFDKIEKALLYNSVGSYIDYDKSTNSNGWEIFVASENLSTDTDIDNVVDSTETLRVSAGGNVSADAGQKVVFQPQVTGGDGMSEITYAWTKDGADTGVTTDTFVIEATTSADVGEYVFTATQGSNSVSCTYVLSVQAENHSHHDISFDKWSEMTDLPIMSGNYYLENEVTLSAIWTVPQGVTNLCINGRVIDLNSYYINVPAGAALNIYTCEDLKQYYDVSDNLWIPVGGFTDENKERYTSGGVITGGSNSAIFVNGGSLTLNGGAIAGNTGNAGGVTLMNGATFTMNGGDIVGNSSKGDAGGVMNNNSTFTMNGGRIHNNYAANNGGGVFNVYENALFTMNGGKIYDNISSVGAGGIGNYEDAEMIVTGGSICGNSTTWGGGGIFNYHSTLTLMGGVIDNNSSTWGGGAVLNEGILHISGAPVIKDNFVNETPNNIYLLYPEFPIVVDGPISSGPIPVSVYPDEGQLDDDFKFTESTDVSLNDASDFEYEYEGYRVEKKNDGQLYIVAYEEPKYEAENGGSVEVTENDDGTVTLSVSVPDGFRFVGWHDGTEIISTDNPYTLVPESGKTYTAKLERIPVYVDTVAGVGSVSSKNNEDGSVTIIARPDTGYIFAGWYDGDKLVSSDESYTFVATDEITYKAKFDVDSSYEPNIPDEPNEPEPEYPELPDTPSGFDFESIRTANGENIVVDHEARTITLDVKEGDDNLMLYVHQKDVIPGGQIRMRSYLGNKVTYDESGVYRIYSIDSTPISVMAKVIIDGVVEDYLVVANYSGIVPDGSFNFESIRTANGESIVVDHESQTITVDVKEGDDNLVLYVHQKEANPGAQIRMKSYNGNKVTYDDSGIYRIYCVNDTSVTVTAKVIADGESREYDLVANYSGIQKNGGFDFTTIRTANGENISVNHETQTITVDVKEGDDNLILYVHQKEANPGAQIRMKSYNGNKVVYEDSGIYRIYTIGGTPITVSANIIVNGETKQYDIVANFTTDLPKFNFNSLSCANAESISVDHESRTITIDAKVNAEELIIYKKQYASLGGTLKMSSYMGNRVVADSENGSYAICHVKNDSVSVKANITVNGETREYVITVNYNIDPWQFDKIDLENCDSISVNHSDKTITADMKDGCDSAILSIDQVFVGTNAQIWMKSYNGNKVQYNAESRNYTITRISADSITVSVKITIKGETRYYDLILNF